MWPLRTRRSTAPRGRLRRALRRRGAPAGNSRGLSGCVYPLVGELKGDDVPAAIRMRCYRALRDKGLLGEGDRDEALWREVGYDLLDGFEVIPLDMRRFYGGPREAIVHAVYRQSFTDLVIGPGHADAPYDDGTPIWADFEAQAIFDVLPGAFEIRSVKIGFAACYESVGRADLTEEHRGESPQAISGTEIHAQLSMGKRLDSRILRPEISKLLTEAAAPSRVAAYATPTRSAPDGSR